MPELPEVETVVRDLRACSLAGRSIVSARVAWNRSVAEPSAPFFCRQIRGLSIRGLRRRGKYAVVELSGGFFLLVHLRMTGRLRVESGPVSDPHARAILCLDDGRSIVFSDPRKFGRIRLTRNPAQTLDRLGPEPLEIPPADFARRLVARSRSLKPLLLDQSFLAGVGNIYADEALWTARLHPLRKSNSLSPSESSALLQALRAVLRRGIRNLGTSLGTGKTNFRLPRGETGRNREHLRAYGRTNLPCPRCGNPIRRVLVAQRSTHLCGSCQNEFAGASPRRRIGGTRTYSSSSGKPAS